MKWGIPVFKPVLINYTFYLVFDQNIMLFVKCLQDDQQKVADKKLEEACADMADAPKVRLSTKKMLKGHINKVNSVHYSGDSR